MQLFFFLRGVNHYTELYKSLVESQFWKWRRTNLTTGKDELSLVQGVLRPSFMGCYEYVFPEEALPEVLATFGIQKENPYSFRFTAIRKAFGLKPVPKWAWEKAKEIKPTLIIDGYERGLSKIEVPSCGMAVIGIKYDKRGEIFGYNQEWL